MEISFWAREDNNSANNPALNPTGAAAQEITFVPASGGGDLLLEYNSGSFDPDTRVEIGGNAYEFSFQLSADLPVQNRDGANQVPEQFKGADVHLIEVLDYPSAGSSMRLFYLPGANATQAEMDAFGTGAVSLQNIDTTTAGIICFAEGTQILTPSGYRLVETLAAGTTVMTHDHGPKRVVWASHSARHWPGSSDKEKPVEIKAGALGAALPCRNLVVSPQHRILLRCAGKECEEVLAPAKGLLDLPGVRVMQGKTAVTYHHVMLEAHGVLVAEGVPSESFYPGKQAQRMLSPAQTMSLRALFPGLDEDTVLDVYGAPARRCLSVGETRALVRDRSGWELALSGRADLLRSA